jgi:hypothetical protein
MISASALGIVVNNPSIGLRADRGLTPYFFRNYANTILNRFMFDQFNLWGKRIKYVFILPFIFISQRQFKITPPAPSGAENTLIFFFSLGLLCETD